MASLAQGTASLAPTGPALVERLATGAGARHCTLTDGPHAVAYGEIGGLLAELDRECSRAGVTRRRRRQPIALECSQSVAGALALLHLLAREQDVVLLPELDDGAKEAGTPRFIPGFCSHVITASARSAARSPLDAIAVAANPGFVEEAAVAGLTGPDLYLRTSGSTGTPKLTRMSHQRWLNNAQACVERWRLSADDRLSIPVPIFHSYGFGAAFLPGLLAGASMDVGSGGSILRYLERERRFAPNVAFLTPALCDAFVAVRKAPRPYRLAVTAGDKVKRETMAAFEPRFGPLLNLYGSAEMGAVSAAAPDDPPERRLATAGYPLRGIELRVAAEPPGGGPGVWPAEGAAAGPAGDPADGQPGAPADGPAGRGGRLLCRQANGSTGYLVGGGPCGGGPWRFEPRGDDAWFETGDLARIRDDGYLEILGRSGLSVKRDGLMVIFADVEAAVERIAGIERAVVVAAGESSRGTRLVAVCVPDRERQLPAPDAVRLRCFDLLPRYAVPDEVVVVPSLPHLPSGKVDRRALRDLLAKPVAMTERDTRELGEP